MVTTIEATKQAYASSRFYKAIQVENVTGGSETLPFLMSQVSSEDLKKSLEQSLDKAHYLSASTQLKYSLKANLMSLEQPMAGINITVRVAIEYTLKDIATGTVIFEESIKTLPTAKIEDAIIGINRLKVANKGVARNNIKKFIDKLDAIK
jgi:hypothetical protein